MLRTILAVLAFVLILVLGIFAVGFTLQLLWWLFLGVIIGGLARLFMPGDREVGLFGTSIAGISGSVLGGSIADHLLDWGWLLQTCLSIACAAVLLAIFTERRRDMF